MVSPRTPLPSQTSSHQDRVIAAPIDDATGAREASVGGAIRLSVEIPIRVLSILATLILTRRLGVLGFGEFIVTLGVALVLAEFADLGLTQSLIPHIVSGRRSVQDIYAVKGQLTAAMIVVGALAVGAVAILSPLDPVTVTLCVAHYVGAGWIECVGNTLRAFGRRSAEAALLLVFRGVLVGLIGLTSLGESPRAVALAYALALVPALLLGAGLVSKHASGPRTAGSWIVLREALPLGLNSGLARLTVRIEVFVLRFLDLAAGLGLFAVSLRVIESLLTLPSALAGGALPALAREARSPEAGPGAAQRTLSLVAWVGIPAGVGMGLRAPEILDLLGPAFVEGAPILRVFSFTLALCFLNTALFHILVAAERGPLIPKLTALRLAVGVMFAVILIPRLGGLGAAIGYAASEVVLLLCLTHAAGHSARFSIARPVGTALLGAAPMGFALWFGPRPLGLAIPMAVIVFALGAALMFRARRRSTGLG